MAVHPTSPAGGCCKVEESRTNKERATTPHKRSKNPGVRVQGGRIYDSEHGKTCHQCRQKTMDFAASCKVVKGNKPCTIKFCHKCLLNRYGENAEEVVILNDWKCPKCRGVCNCSFCMKKKGHKPTGILVHTAKLTGFSSVHELLSHGGTETGSLLKDASASPDKSHVVKKGLVPSKRGRDKENCNFVQDGAGRMEIDGTKVGWLEKKQEKPLKKLKQSSHGGINSEGGDVGQVNGKLHTLANVLLAEAEHIKETINGISKDAGHMEIDGSKVSSLEKQEKPSKKSKQLSHAGINSRGSKVGHVKGKLQTPANVLFAEAGNNQENLNGNSKDGVCVEIDGAKVGLLEKNQEKPLKKAKQLSHAGINSRGSNVGQVKGKLQTPANVLLAEAGHKNEKLNGISKDGGRMEIDGAKVGLLEKKQEKLLKKLNQSSHGGINSRGSKVGQVKGKLQTPANVLLVEAGQNKENLNCTSKDGGCMEIDCTKVGSPVKKQEKPLKKSKQSKHTGINSSNVGQVKGKLQTPATVLLAEAEHNNENLNGTSKDMNILKHPKLSSFIPKLVTEPVKEVVVRPPGKPLTVVAGVELPQEDVGSALQFLEFCSVFSKVLDIKKGEPEAIIRELVRSSTVRRCRLNSAIIQFQTRLLNFIVDDLEEELSLETKGENSWLKVLSKLLSESKHLSSELHFDFFNDSSQYNNLDLSKKLRILVFLCDEALGTESLRKFIDEENASFVEEKRERNEQVIAAKRKERLIKQTLKDDLAKAMLSTNGDTQLSVEEHTNLILNLRSETEKAHKEMLESIELLPKQKQMLDALRARPMFLEKDGLVFWKLKSYKCGSCIILQDIDNWSINSPKDKWFSFENEEQEVLERYISSLRCQKARQIKHRLKNINSSEVKHDSLDNSKSQNSLTEVNEVDSEANDLTDGSRL